VSLRSLSDGVERRLGPSLPVEEQRIIGASPERKVVQQGMALLRSPEGDATDHVPVAQDVLKRLPVAPGMLPRPLDLER
jgi:hypothetical protein